ncbi:phosphate ABC transporter substrate-binding protein [Alteromonas sp. MB-3u-76]|uniref:phosphate/phosphite/phosphonate ABC transporter substrate-binding protein n=1 Tax=Alteromonas sp. MB-3u-76 TaxID=2058133 RepID=UPI000C30D5EB|nr:phosphate/phosphite/phosphonate ABC transporter substrate-binding protein [Alteromonas sp. MB-3u-76]AUC89731.1 phosphate ABC transporter substrate-binding protein [Alteromonas sp. MB-3u-76]
MLRVLCLLFVFLSLLVTPTLHAQSLIFGVVPQQSAKKMVKSWQPLVDYINSYTGLRIEFQTAKDIPTFEANLSKGKYDIAYMNPFHFVVFNSTAGYKALAKQKNKFLKGIIVVHKDSEITSLDALNGAEIAFPAPAAFAATIVTSAKLRKENIAFIPRYVNSHDSVYLNVEKQFFKAGGGIYRTLGSSSANTSLRVLWESPDYTPHAIATHPTLGEDTRQAIINALLSISSDASKAHILKNLGLNGFISADDSHWDDVRALGISSLSRPHS